MQPRKGKFYTKFCSELWRRWLLKSIPHRGPQISITFPSKFTQHMRENAVDLVFAYINLPKRGD